MSKTKTRKAVNIIVQMKEKKHIYTVSELTHDVKALLENNFSTVWIEGEISNFKRHSSGHIYFSLKDSDSLLRAVLFKNVNQNIKFEPKDGLQVVCFGRVTVYGRSGQYQINVLKIEPRGAGALQLAFEQLKEKLRKEGLFDQQHKKAIPFLPQRIGVVTSPTGAAFRDILHVLHRRFANLEVVLNPVKVQGEGSAEEVAKAIDEFNSFARVDVLIIGRGGGSLEDLWAFNEEILARAIYRSKIPVISAVGHEVDYTISDFVADLRAPTPSAAAEVVTKHKQELLDKIESFASRIQLVIFNTVDIWQQRLGSIKERYAFRRPADLIEQYQQRADEATSTLDSKVNHLIEKHQERFKGLVGKLHALSPIDILSRGYSITSTVADEKTIRTTASMAEGVRIRTRLAKGELISKIEEIL